MRLSKIFPIDEVVKNLPNDLLMNSSRNVDLLLRQISTISVGISNPPPFVFRVSTHPSLP
jgi:hypothetical protein